MPDTTYWETFKIEGKTIVERLRELIHEGNVRRIVIQHEGRTVAEFPVTAGVIGALVAPVLAAVGALVALLRDCTIQVERDEPKDMNPRISSTRRRTWSASMSVSSSSLYPTLPATISESNNALSWNNIPMSPRTFIICASGIVSMRSPWMRMTPESGFSRPRIPRTLAAIVCRIRSHSSQLT